MQKISKHLSNCFSDMQTYRWSMNKTLSSAEAFLRHSKKQAHVLKELTTPPTPAKLPIGTVTQTDALLKLLLKDYKDDNTEANVQSFLRLHDEFYKIKEKERK